MSNEESFRKKAEDVFKTMCSAFDKKKINYKADGDNLSVLIVSDGKDLTMGFRIRIITKLQTILLTSPIPIDIKPSKRLDIAVAVTKANHIILDGSFDYDLKDGKVAFRLTSSFLDMEVNEEEFIYLILVAYKVVEDFNDRFEAVNNGTMEPDDICDGLL